MNVVVRYFAGHRDIAKRAEEQFELPDDATVGSLWALLVEHYPRLVGYTGRMLYAVNQEYSQLDTPLHDGDEVAYIPPVSGGSAGNNSNEFFRITSEPLEPGALMALVQSPDMGAIVTFTGIVRNHFANRPTAALEYEAFEPMASSVLADLASQARTQWGTGAIAIHHRVGHLGIGETAVLIVVAAPHRHEAFEAAEWLMDRIKEVAPIWKKEHWADGESEWAEDEKTRKNIR